MVLLLFENIQEALIVDVRGGQFRNVESPPAEKSIRGPQEGFIENLNTNIAMVRRRLMDPNLVCKITQVGKRSRTPVALMYIRDIAEPTVVAEVQARIDRIDTDVIPDTAYLEQFIEDNPYSLFPQVWHTERPDRVMVELLEGKIAILGSGTPLVLIVPASFVTHIQTSEDYYDRLIFGNYWRLIRFMALLMAISLPALYISLLSFNPELIPLELLVRVAEARKKIPYPVLVEVLLQEAIIQIVVEAGLRLPGPVGQTIGVVAGIILGQAAISANLASPAVIIIALTTLSTYSLPSSGLVNAVRLTRLLFIFITAIFGIWGFSLAWLILFTHLISLENMGIPYFVPFAPTLYADMKDAFLRTSLRKMNFRPRFMPLGDRKRQGNTGGDHNNQ